MIGGGWIGRVVVNHRGVLLRTFSASLMLMRMDFINRGRVEGLV